MPLRALCFDLDDTLWPCKPVINHAEQVLYDWLSKYYPRLTQEFSLEALGTMRQRATEMHPHLRHDLTTLRKWSLAQAATQVGLSDSLVEPAFEVFMTARHQVNLYPVIYVSLEFVADFETSTIDLTVRNFTDFEEKTYTLVPDEINDCFLDELAKYITRQPNLMVLREKNPLAHRRSKTLRTKASSKSLVTKTDSTTEDCNEFEQWLRTQEQHLATAKKPPTTKSKSKGLFQLIKKIGQK